VIAKLCVVVIRHMRQQPRRTALAALSFAGAVFIYTVLIAVPATMDRKYASARSVVSRAPFSSRIGLAGNHSAPPDRAVEPPT